MCVRFKCDVLGPIALELTVTGDDSIHAFVEAAIANKVKMVPEIVENQM